MGHPKIRKLYCEWSIQVWLTGFIKQLSLGPLGGGPPLYANAMPWAIQRATWQAQKNLDKALLLHTAYCLDRWKKHVGQHVMQRNTVEL